MQEKLEKVFLCLIVAEMYLVDEYYKKSILDVAKMYLLLRKGILY